MQVSSFAFLKETFSEERKVNKDTSTGLSYTYNEECMCFGRVQTPNITLSLKIPSVAYNPN